jgi:hypothetical protein
MTWRLPDTYHLAGHGRGTATLKFYEGRDILVGEGGGDAPGGRVPQGRDAAVVGGGEQFAVRAERHGHDVTVPGAGVGERMSRAPWNFGGGPGDH